MSIRKIASVACTSDFEESELISILDDCLQDFPNIQSFSALQFFQLFPRLAEAAMKSEMCSIVVVSPLVSVMQDQVEQLKQLGVSAAEIGLGEEYGEDEKAAREWKCELVFRN